MAKKLEILDERYDIFIKPLARQKMEIYCKLCDTEIGWMGSVSFVEGLGYLIEDVFLLKQGVHSTTTEIDPGAMLDLWATLPEEAQDKMHFWGHSHVNMEPNPSGQDNSQMEYFKDGNDWFIRLITNKKGTMHVTFYDYKNGIKIIDDELKTYAPELTALEVEIAKEIKDKVFKIVYKAPAAAKPVYSNYGNNNKGSGNYYKNKKNQFRKKVDPIFDDIKIKYYASFAEVLNDPDYWQQNVL